MAMIFGLLGRAFGRLGAASATSGSGGGSPPPSVALKADLSDANANEAWVFW